MEKRTKWHNFALEKRTDYAWHSAMDNVLKVPNYGINEGFVFCNDNVSTKGSVTYRSLQRRHLISIEV